MANFNPSPYQQAIFDFVQRGTGNAIIDAVAGSGKSTTIVEALKYTQGSALFLAFNKSIATALQPRVPAHVQARTFHSLCYSPVLKVTGARAVNTDKIRDIVRRTLTEADAKMYGAFVRKLVGLARQIGVGCLCEDTEEAWSALVEHHDIVLESEYANEAEGIALARKILRTSNQSSEVDFDDMLYFAVLKGVRLPAFDWVFVDEAQDTNAIQRAILRKLLARGGRLIAVGDAAQAIYGFRGADSNALNLLAEEFAPCERLPLSVTYRCARAITEYAQDYVPAIQPREGAPEGEVNALDQDFKLTDLGQRDIVICRTTAPLIDLGYQMLRARIPLRILGKDIGEGLAALVRKCDRRGAGLEAMLTALEKWRIRESEKAIAKGQDSRAEAIEDKASALALLAEGLPEGRRTVAVLLRVLEELFTDANSRVTLSTVHKAKGLEAETVWWLGRSLCPSRWAKQEWQQQQEANIIYVAITRAALRLNMIETAKTLGTRREA